MIKRPGHLIFLPVNIEFNYSLFTELEIDLKHINHGGKTQAKRSNFSIEEVEAVVVDFLDGSSLVSAGEETFGDDIKCYYFKVSKLVGEINYRLVVCVCSDKPKTLGVITLFRSDK